MSIPIILECELSQFRQHELKSIMAVRSNEGELLAYMISPTLFDAIALHFKLLSQTPKEVKDIPIL